MTALLLLAAIVIFACVLGNRVSQRFGVPTLLAFIVLGMLFGSDGLFRIDFDNYIIVEDVCSAALIAIMFYGGFGTNWREARPVAVRASLLSSLGVVLTSLLTGLFCRYALGFSMLEGMLLGAILGSTDAASVFSILRSKRLNLKGGTASLLEVESGSNDPFAYMMTVLLLSAMQGEGLSFQSILVTAGLQLVLGVFFGVAIGKLGILLMRRFPFGTSGLDAACLLGIALLSYAVPTLLGGNGYLSAYLAGLLLGNADLPGQRGLVHFFDGMTGLMQMLIFFLLGLLSFPSRLPQVLPIAIPVALFLTFAARPGAVFLLLTPFRCPVRQQLLVSWAGLRGAASIVFAVLAVNSPAVLESDIYHIVFAVVLLSIAFQGSLLPAAARKLDMIGTEDDVMRTFSDYAAETEVEFIQLDITPGHPWEGKTLSELAFPPGLLCVMILRGDTPLTPRGKTILRAGDSAVLCAASFAGHEEEITLSEFPLTDGHPWVQKRISSLGLPPQELIVLIRRDGKAFVPGGGTLLRSGDRVVIGKG